MLPSGPLSNEKVNNILLFDTMDKVIDGKYQPSFNSLGRLVSLCHKPIFFTSMATLSLFPSVIPRNHFLTLTCSVIASSGVQHGSPKHIGRNALTTAVATGALALPLIQLASQGQVDPSAALTYIPYDIAMRSLGVGLGAVVYKGARWCVGVRQ